jgi:putative redox protein
MALGGCFMSNLLAAAKSRDAELSNVTLAISGTVESALPRFSAVHMSITEHRTDRELMEKLVAIAERGCIVANTLRGSAYLSISLASG